MPRFKNYHLHLPYFRFDDSREMRLLYVIRVIRDMVNRVAFFFLPIFLFLFGRDHEPFTNLTIGANLDLTAFQQGMLMIAFYFLASHVVKLLSIIPASQFINRFGFEWSFGISHLMYALMFAAFYATIFNPWFLLVAIILDGIQTPFFWNGYLTLLSRYSSSQHMGQDLGILNFLLQLVGAISPALAGMVAYWLGLEFVFLIGLVLTVIGLLFIPFMSSKPARDRVYWQEFFDWMKSREFRRLSTSFAGRYFNDAVLFIWPLYVFFILGSVDRVGYLYTVSLILALIISLVAGVYIDRYRSRRPFFASGGVLSLLWLARTQAFTIWGIALVDMMERLVANFHWLFFDSSVMRRSKGRQALSYFSYREIILSFSAFFFWIAFAIFFVVVDIGWQSLFLFAGLGVLLSLLVKDRFLESVRYPSSLKT